MNLRMFWRTSVFNVFAVLGMPSLNWHFPLFQFLFLFLFLPLFLFSLPFSPPREDPQQISRRHRSSFLSALYPSFSSRCISPTTTCSQIFWLLGLLIAHFSCIAGPSFTHFTCASKSISRSNFAHKGLRKQLLSPLPPSIFPLQKYIRFPE
jgi:hypothetical protein